MYLVPVFPAGHVPHCGVPAQPDPVPGWRGDGDGDGEHQTPGQGQSATSCHFLSLQPEQVRTNTEI